MIAWDFNFQAITLILVIILEAVNDQHLSNMQKKWIVWKNWSIIWSNSGINTTYWYNQAHWNTVISLSTIMILILKHEIFIALDLPPPSLPPKFSPEPSFLVYTKYGGRWRLRSEFRLLGPAGMSAWVFKGGIIYLSIVNIATTLNTTDKWIVASTD